MGRGSSKAGGGSGGALSAVNQAIDQAENNPTQVAYEDVVDIHNYS